MKNRLLQRKLKSYSALAGTMAAASIANSQIVYTDIVPDDTSKTPPGGTFQLDLDNNGIVDFIIQTTDKSLSNGNSCASSNPSSNSCPWYFTVVTPTDTNGLNMVSVDDHPIAHNLGDTICSGLSWNNDPDQFMTYLKGSSYYGNWFNTTDKYLAFQFVDPQDTTGTIYYGWARLSVGFTGEQFIIKDYAYSKECLLAGETGLPDTTIIIDTNNVVNEYELRNFVNIYNTDKIINVDILNSFHIEGNIIVRDILGQEISKVKISDKNIRISMEHVKTGLYFVTVNNDSEQITKKVVIR